MDSITSLGALSEAGSMVPWELHPSALVPPALPALPGHRSGATARAVPKVASADTALPGGLWLCKYKTGCGKGCQVHAENGWDAAIRIQLCSPLDGDMQNGNDMQLVMTLPAPRTQWLI